MVELGQALTETDSLPTTIPAAPPVSISSISIAPPVSPGPAPISIAPFPAPVSIKDIQKVQVEVLCQALLDKNPTLFEQFLTSPDLKIRFEAFKLLMAYRFGQPKARTDLAIQATGEVRLRVSHQVISRNSADTPDMPGRRAGRPKKELPAIPVKLVGLTPLGPDKP